MLRKKAVEKLKPLSFNEVIPRVAGPVAAEPVVAAERVAAAESDETLFAPAEPEAVRLSSADPERSPGSKPSPASKPFGVLETPPPADDRMVASADAAMLFAPEPAAAETEASGAASWGAALAQDPLAPDSLAQNPPAQNPPAQEFSLAQAEARGQRKAPRPSKSPKPTRADRALTKSSSAVPLTKPSPPAAKVRPAKAPATPGLPGWARSAYWIAVPAAALWAGAMAAFASGYQNPFGPFEYRPYPVAAFAGLCLLPAVFILLAAYAVRQGAKLSLETRRARELAQDLAIPAALAADQAGGAAEAVRLQVDRVAEAAAAAEHQLLSLRRALAEESERLIDAGADAERRARNLTEGLAREREAMGDLSDVLEAQTLAAAQSMAAQSRLVADASDLAATHIQEAEAVLAARAGDLAAAAGDAGELAHLAGQSLAIQVDRLEAASGVFSDRVGAVQGALSGEHQRLLALADSLRADQEAIAARIEAQRTQLVAASADARSGARNLAESSAESGQTLRALIASVAEQVSHMTATAEADQAALGAEARGQLKLFTGVVAEERAALEAESRRAIGAMQAAAVETRRAAAEQTEAARAHVEQLGEAAFAAGQKADQVFDARIGAARRMIEQSASLVEDAGHRSAERIESGLAATHDAMLQLDGLLGAIDAKVAALPEGARTRAETVRRAVEQGMGELTAAARKAAEETQAIDAAFQGRIKHNYEVLSEAMRLMSRVADAADAAAKAPPARPQPMAMAEPGLAPRPAAPLATPLAETDRSIRVPPETFAAAAGATPESIGLRPRLKLSVDAPAAKFPFAETRFPAAAAPIQASVQAPLPKTPLPQAPSPQTPMSLAAAPQAATPEPLRRSAPPPRPASDRPSRAQDADEWTWKDLLSSIEEPALDDEVLAERLISEIEALGLDAPTLLPLSRIDEIAAVMQAGDIAGARDVVRGLAPAAVRRLSRRVLTDKVLRAHADRYLQRYEDLLTDSAKRDRDGFVTATLLGSDPGRAFLLFNAAVGELH